MTPPVLTLFNNKSGVGKTSLIYHLAWAFASLEKNVLVADLDPQANLTAAFLDEDRVDELWNSSSQSGNTIYQCIKPLMDLSDIAVPKLEKITSKLSLIPGDVGLSGFEDRLADEWPRSMGDNNLYRPMRILTCFWQVLRLAAKQADADLILVDTGPNLGAINRSALLATAYVLIPLGADLFSLQGLSNLGPTLKSWRHNWHRRRDNWQASPESSAYPDFLLPDGSMQPLGYLCQQHGVRLERPVQAYDKWVQRIPSTYRQCVLSQQAVDGMQQSNDPHCLATIRHYRSLMAMGQERRKPIFQLSAADGAIGAHANAVQAAKRDFRELASKIAERIAMPLDS